MLNLITLLFDSFDTAYHIVNKLPQFRLRSMTADNTRMSVLYNFFFYLNQIRENNFPHHYRLSHGFRGHILIAGVAAVRTSDTNQQVAVAVSSSTGTWPKPDTGRRAEFNCPENYTFVTGGVCVCRARFPVPDDHPER